MMYQGRMGCGISKVNPVNRMTDSTEPTENLHPIHQIANNDAHYKPDSIFDSRTGVTPNFSDTPPAPNKAHRKSIGKNPSLFTRRTNISPPVVNIENSNGATKFDSDVSVRAESSSEKHKVANERRETTNDLSTINSIITANSDDRDRINLSTPPKIAEIESMYSIPISRNSIAKSIGSDVAVEAAPKTDASSSRSEVTDTALLPPYLARTLVPSDNKKISGSLNSFRPATTTESTAESLRDDTPIVKEPVNSQPNRVFPQESIRAPTPANIEKTATPQKSGDNSTSSDQKPFVRCANIDGTTYITISPRRMGEGGVYYQYDDRGKCKRRIEVKLRREEMNVVVE